jgi:alanine racemase
MSRPAVARIQLAALRHNYRLAKRLHGGRALAVVKANAYGHGAIPCARALAPEADGFAVAAIEEALALRAAGISSPILLLEGFFDPSELGEIVRQRLWTVVHHRWQVEALVAARLAAPLTLWLKLDSGMHRVGLSPREYRTAAERLRASANVADIVLMTHFARADETDCGATLAQIVEFRAATKGLIGEVSLSNSAAVLAWPQARGDWARPGILLYGASPFGADDPAAAGLKPVMQLESKIIAVQELAAGEPIGYGARYVADRNTRVGVVACGYADGYPRTAGTGTPVQIDGRPSRLIGRVSMDMLTVDLTDLPHAGIGSSVELWGESVPAGDVAAQAGTIAYELYCNVKRVRFDYVD